MTCPDDPSRSNLAGWLLLGLALAVIAIDVVLLKTGRPTMSQWAKRITRGRPWWKAFGLSVIGVTLWHLFFGGPL